MRVGLACLLLSTVGLADAAADRAMLEGYQEFIKIISRQDGNLQLMRDRIVNNFAKAGPRYRTSVLKNFPRAFQKKYALPLSTRAVLAETLAGCGTKGLAKLKQILKGNRRDPDVRVVIAEALGRCGDTRALPILTGTIIWDKDPKVAAVGVEACVAYSKGTQQVRKDTMKTLIECYVRATDAAAGKKSESKPARRYRALKPALNRVLRAFSGGAELDSAAAWKAWLEEHMTKKLPEG
ncbi:MAG: HEAT repeat domain-containing protein [Planctomycetota bacterium]